MNLLRPYFGHRLGSRPCLEVHGRSEIQAEEWHQGGAHWPHPESQRQATERQAADSDCLLRRESQSKFLRVMCHFFERPEFLDVHHLGVLSILVVNNKFGLGLGDSTQELSI